jgi:hypothetical protein
MPSRIKNQVQRHSVREYCHVFHQVLVAIYLLCTGITSDKEIVLYMTAGKRQKHLIGQWCQHEGNGCY